MIPGSRALTRLSLGGCATVLGTLALALSACGGDAPATAGGTTATTVESGASTSTPRAPAAVRDRRCERQVSGFLAAMDTLRERLVAGLSYEQYVEEIELVRSSYDEVPIDELAIGCLLAAGTPGEKAFVRYIDAANSWGECIEETGCDALTVEPLLQKQWRRASRLLDEAQRGLRTS